MKTNNEQSSELIISLPKIIGGIITSLVIGAVIGSFGVVRVVDSTSFKVIAIDSELEQVQAIVVPRAEYDLRKEQVDRDFERIENQYKSIDNKLDRLLGIN